MYFQTWRVFDHFNINLYVLASNIAEIKADILNL